VSCPHLFDVAPYALGTLDPGERAGVAAHMASCEDCQAVLESVAGLPGLLARVGPDAVEPDELEPDEAMFQRFLARARPESEDTSDRTVEPQSQATTVLGHPSSRRTSRWRRWAAAGVAAAAVVVAGGAGTWLIESRQQNDVRTVAASAGNVHARAWLRPIGSGTDIRLELGGVAAEQECRLITVDRRGNTAVASTWEAGYPGTETFESKVPLSIDQLAALRVETDQGPLVTMSVQ
jgi:predicted anti-sigma-YlaC factor YlaD